MAPKRKSSESNPIVDDETVPVVSWPALDAYFSSNPYFITKHHLESYDDFVSRIPGIIKTLNPFTIFKPYSKEPDVIKHEIHIYIGGEKADRIRFQPSDPNLRPNEARMYNKTYATDIIVDVDVKYVYNEKPERKGDEMKKTEETVRITDVKLASVPTMLHSKRCKLHGRSKEELKALGECVYDQGGYFIVDGKEKVIIAQERIAANTLFVEKVDSDADKRAFHGHILCKSEDSSVFPKTIHIDVVKGRKDMKSPDKNCSQSIGKDCIHLSIPHITKNGSISGPSQPIPLFVLFRALGVETDGAIMQLLNLQTARETDFFHASVMECHDLKIFNQTGAIEWLRQFVEFRTNEHVMFVLHENLFPQLGDTSLTAKAVLLAEYAKKLVKVAVGLAPPTDRDNFIHKRVDISGYLMADVFKDFYNEFRVYTRNKIDKHYEYGGWNDRAADISDLITDNTHFDSRIITDRFRKSLKGKWGLSGKDGIVQDLSRVSYMSFVSHLRRLTSPMDSSIKIRRPHQLNTDQFGFMCPSESPDGADIGIIKNFAMLCKVSFNVPSDCVREATLQFFNADFVSVMDILKRPSFEHHSIRINNNWWGSLPDVVVPDYVKYLRLLRRNGFLNAYTSISWSIRNKSIHILTEGGRCCRPLLIVKNSKILFNSKKHKGLSWSELIGGAEALTNYVNPVKALKLDKDATIDEVIHALVDNASAVIEYIDVEETNTGAFIAMEPADITATTTHCEIHPTTMLSMYTATIPLANHNAGPRNIFSGAQGKQAIGIYATNFNNRIDTMAYVLHYPQQPLVQTRYAEYLGYNNMPNGENTIVAIMTYTGYNMEDSILINQAAVDRGLFNLSYFKSIIDEEKDGVHFGNTKDMYLRGEISTLPKAVYDGKINEDGLPIPETYLEEGDPVIGKYKRTVAYVNADEDKSRIFANIQEQVTCEEITEFIDKTIESTVDKVISYKNKDDAQEVKVRMRKFRKPEFGDKLACYDEATEVLTSIGWVKWADLTMENRVASLNSDMQMIYVPPKNVFSYDHDGDMVQIETDGVDLLVTPNHKLLLAYDQFQPFILSRADNNLEKNFWIPKTFPIATDCTAEDVLHFNGSVYKLVDVLPFFLLTFLASKVETTMDGKQRLHYVLKNPSHILCVTQMCHLGYIKNATWHEGVYTIDVKDVDLSGFVVNSRSQMMQILFNTPSHRLQQAFQQMLVSCGDAVCIADQNELQHLLLHGNFSSAIKGGVLSIDARPSIKVVAKEHASMTKYTGKVYCAETENGILCVRRNGVVVWCGNSRHAQKGVIGMVMPEQDMPFTKEGLRPDIIINPHALPTRMTVAHILECVCAKAGATYGFKCDGTPFEKQDFESIYDALENAGMHRHGDEILYNGRTGQQIETQIFMGPTYYLRLKHMVADKINYRITGPRVAMTHQPTQGRGNDGGLRIGEMETNCLIAHGIAGFAKESLMERSDAYNGHIDTHTGMFTADAESDSVFCPYAFKLLTQEMMVMGIKPIMYTHREEEPFEDADAIDDWRAVSGSEDEGGSDDEAN